MDLNWEPSLPLLALIDGTPLAADLIAARHVTAQHGTPSGTLNLDFAIHCKKNTIKSAVSLGVNNELRN